MRLMGSIDGEAILGQIREHLKLWEEMAPRTLPNVRDQVGIQPVSTFCD